MSSVFPPAPCHKPLQTDPAFRGLFGVFFEQGAGRADLDAFSAIGAGGAVAPRLCQITDDPAVCPPSTHIPGVGALDLVAYPHTPPAEDTAVVVDAEARLGYVNRQARRNIPVTDMIDPQLRGQGLELTIAVHHADRTGMVAFRQQQFNDHPPCGPETLRIRA